MDFMIALCAGLIGVVFVVAGVHAREAECAGAFVLIGCVICLAAWRLGSLWYFGL